MLARNQIAAAVIAAGISLSACKDAPPIRDIASVHIDRLDQPKDRRGAGRTLRVDDDPSVAALARSLERCRGPEMVIFKARFSVRAVGRDGTEVTFLVFGEFAKIEGVAFKCSEDLATLVERALASKAPAAHD